ncbi:DHH family phosphoesterase [[Clostridium] polysaccharolyticum]|uniref:Cyclic-di-AMP phosphodiesterase n=1 Tax=[Clostridium] polysaccharolyticum TaxID=29364 RepID=A0A1I0BNL3_9FIRM|nr:DHH family phosphoesterase [[Clostridium] polysaccharolyticum]SET08555.1 c-di-AMP phosphodiesterase, consists of a GGDEF-like and DHH domains [[Clostridium] polysaccharolyticum]
MKTKGKLRGSLKSYLRLPLMLSVLLIIMDLSIFCVDREAGLLMTGYVIVYLVISVSIFFYKNAKINSDLVDFALSYGQVQKQLVKEMALPYAILDSEGRLLWGNDEFMSIIEHESSARRNIANVLPGIHQEAFPRDAQDEEVNITYQDADYRVIMRRIIVGDFEESEDYLVDNISEGQNILIAMYMFDETEKNAYMKENKDQRMIAGLVYIDNYEEALESIDEVRRSLLIALIDRKINKYFQNIDALVKKLEKDKYLLIFKQKYLNELQASRFSLLDEVKAVNIGNDMAVTISIGLGVNGENYARSYEFARAAIDLALGRGGDQAVVKEGEKIVYYGGKSVQMQKTTRVKARVKAHALKELVEAKDKVVIMGHSIGDVDSFGAAIGIYRIAKTLGKKANIVINDVTKTVRPILKRFTEVADYESDMFVNGLQAKEIVDANTLLVVVDVNRPSYTECPELLGLTKTIVVFDHHRQTGESIENAVLSYIEPYASSTCEMVAEMLQYIGDGLRLRSIESDALYSGIIIDTDNFQTKTGVRTFEAAAFLRRNGADITKIRKSLRSDVDEYQVRAAAVRDVEVYLDVFAITGCNAQNTESPTVVGAQVANELLNINNIKASFVLTEFAGKVYISARSIDEVNVQIIMEQLGGGGHMSVAGAQLVNVSVEEARDILKETLDKMKKEGEL